jgi:hypothetical protein
VIWGSTAFVLCVVEKAHRCEEMRCADVMDFAARSAMLGRRGILCAVPQGGVEMLR